MLEEPFFREFTRVGKRLDGETADIMDGLVELGYLCIGECVAILFGVDASIVHYLVAREKNQISILYTCEAIPSKDEDEENLPNPIPNSTEIPLVQQQRLDGNLFASQFLR